MIGFDLTPPEETERPIDRLRKWGIAPVYMKEEKLWVLPGVEMWGDDVSIGYLMDDQGDDETDKRLTSRDLEAVEHIINNILDVPNFEIGQEIWRERLDRYADYANGGPSVNVKLHDTYEFWQVMEKATGISIEEHEVDPEGWIWNDAIDHEMDWFTGTVLDNYPALDTTKFMRMGRSGGHLVYDIGNSDSSRCLTFAECEDLLRLWEEVPTLLRDIAMDIVGRLWSHVFNDSWEKQVDKWRKREQKAVAKCIRKGLFERAAWHQANLDAEAAITHWDYTDSFEFVWEILWNYEKVKNPQPE